jgi:hypothetical protein
MIFGTPISWFINEIIGSALLLICIAHAIKMENPLVRLLELFCYMITAGIFENIGVWQNVYYYSLDRVMMFGKVPFSILFIEGAILYSTVLLVERLQLPKWAIPFGAGVLSSIQDMTLDPASVYDFHNISGVMEGQWNWTKHYDGGFVDIPFFNFSGWLTMILFFSACMFIGRHIYERKQKKWIGIAYPFVSIIITVVLLVSPINQFLLYAMPIAKINTKSAELVLMTINFAVCIFILLKFAKYTKPLEKEDSLVFFVPIFLHLYALVSSVVLDISAAIVPVIIVAVIHSG